MGLGLPVCASRIRTQDAKLSNHCFVDVRGPAASHSPSQPTQQPTPLTPHAMSSIVARSAFRAAPRLRATPIARRWASTAADEAQAERDAGKKALKTGAKRDPELYVRCVPGPVA
jgi:hypothetical protein